MKNEKLNLNNQLLSQTQKESLINKIYTETKGRRDSEFSPSMYISLTSSEFTLTDIQNGLLSEILRNPDTARVWSNSWGKTLVGVRPENIMSFDIQTKGKENKSFIFLETTKLVKPSSRLSGSQQGKNIILINDTAVSIEGLVVEVSHLVDELVSFRADGDNYSNTIKKILNEGIQFIPANENEILNHTLSVKKISTRLYGSMSIPHVPKVLGCVFYSEDELPSPILLNEPDVVNKSVESSETLEISGDVSFGLGITFGKPLHIGHLLNITTGELGRLSACGREVRIFSNDTAPRLAKMIVSLSSKFQLSILDVTNLLRSGSFTDSEIVEAYRSRDSVTDLESLPLAEKEVRKGGGIVSVLEKNVADNLVLSGFQSVKIVRESDLQDLARQIVSAVSTDWSDTGFTIARTNAGLNVLQKGGEVTSTAKISAFLFDSLNENNGLCLVDSENSSCSAAEVVRSVGGNVDQMSGVGAGILGELGSGTLGNLPEFNTLVERFGGDLREVLIFYILTSPLTSTVRPNGRNTNTYYDFASSESVVNSLSKSYLELQKFKLEVIDLYDLLGKSELFSEKSSTSASQQIANIQYSMSVSKIISNMRRLEVVSEDQSINSIVEKYKSVWGGDLKQDIYSLILDSGIKNNLDMIDLLKVSRKIISSGPLPSKLIPLKSVYLDTVLSQGYTGGLALEQVQKYRRGTLFLLRRQNLYWNKIKSITRVLTDPSQISKTDALVLKQVLDLSLSKIGIKI